MGSTIENKNNSTSQSKAVILEIGQEYEKKSHFSPVRMDPPLSVLYISPPFFSYPAIWQRF